MVFVLISVTFRGLFYVILFVLYMVLLLSCIFEVFLLKLCIDCNSIVVGFFNFFISLPRCLEIPHCLKIKVCISDETSVIFF